MVPGHSARVPEGSTGRRPFLTETRLNRTDRDETRQRVFMQCQKDKFFPNEISLVRVVRSLAEAGGRRGQRGGGSGSFLSFYGLLVQESTPASLQMALLFTHHALFCFRQRKGCHGLSWRPHQAREVTMGPRPRHLRASRSPRRGGRTLTSFPEQNKQADNTIQFCFLLVCRCVYSKS